MIFFCAFAACTGCRFCGFLFMQLFDQIFDPVCIFRSGVPVKAQTREGPQLDAGSQLAAQKTGSALQSGEDFFAAFPSFDGGNIAVSVALSTVHVDSCYHHTV